VKRLRYFFIKIIRDAGNERDFSSEREAIGGLGSPCSFFLNWPNGAGLLCIFFTTSLLILPAVPTKKAAYPQRRQLFFAWGIQVLNNS
jgi:hypothetical protein